MDYYNPADIPLPAFLDPLLQYLSSNVPPPLYSFLITAFSYALALFTGLLNLLLLLASTDPREWDVQTILPPLISILAAYLVLVSVYRTTTWMVRTSIWMLKWGVIISSLAAGAGFIMGNQHGGGGVGQWNGAGGFIPAISGMLFGVTNGPRDNAGEGSNPLRSRTNTPPREPRPKPWESFDRHQQWQYQENANGEQPNVVEEMQRFAGNVMEAVRDSGWWGVAQGLMNDLGQERSDEREREPKDKSGRRKGRGRKARTEDGNDT
ncbi:hypothetical protein EW146_g645 [Bondarzewia mesenterica]|uniref:Uncharacterized protein n=1 Tax=Bondarzewia mesenterica TaxID=1095465 RepID=A0A4S4M6V4_9AGAM|nr:hypothetical protein EW146_g645 [Bondarzewia mesenterica]